MSNNFKPDYTPIEMIKLGVFNGAYFTDKSISNDWIKFVKNDFLLDLYENNVNLYLLHGQPNVNKNRYKVQCGSTYYDWIDRNWIEDIDPYGWFNWYINYHYGRRCYDDNRQIKRWLQFKARHLGMLKSRGEKYKLPTNNLKTKQNLLHWAINWSKH